MKYTVITKDGSKWLTVVPSKPIWGNEKEWMEEVLSEDLPYIGSRPEGTTVDEGEVKEVRQSYNLILKGWQEVSPHDWACNIRTVYTDAEPDCPECGKYCSCPEEDIYDAVADYRKNHPEPSHDHHIRPFNTQNVRPLVNQLVGEEISFSRFVELLNEEAAK